MGLKTKEQSRRKMTFIKLSATKEDKKVFNFYLQEKDQGSGKWESTEDFVELEGYLSKIEPSSYTYEGDVINTVTMDFLDSDDTNSVIRVNAGLNKLVSSLLNSLAGLSNLGKLRLSLYPNNNGYTSIYVENDGEKASWKYAMEDIPKTEKITSKSGKVVGYDTEEFDEFFINVIKDEIQPLIEKSGVPQGDAQNQSQTEEVAEETTKKVSKAEATTVAKSKPQLDLDIDDDSDDDDLPF